MVRSAGFAPAFQPWHSCVLLLDDDHMRWCGMSVLPRRDEFGRLACYCYINAAMKMAAGVGSAPTSADLQSAAHLSEPSSVR